MPETLSSIFAALADATRRAIIERLASGPASAGELADPFGISKPAISKHLKVLESADLIVRHKKAQQHIFELNAPTLTVATEWIERYRAFWDRRLDSLDSFLATQTKGGTP